MTVRALQGFALIGLLLSVACAPPPAPTAGTAADEAALRALGGKYAEMWNKKDIAGLVTMTTDDYEVVAPDGKVIKGRAAFEEAEKQAVTERTGLPLKLNVTTSYLKWGGANSAAIGGTWTMDGLPPGIGANKGAWTAFVVRGADNQWRMASGLVADAPTPPPVVAPAPGKGK
jgi:ketosteroid isomerase-like protein